MSWGKEWPFPVKALSEEEFKKQYDQKVKMTIIYSTPPEFPAIKFDGMVTVDLDKEGNITAEGKQAIVADMQKVYNNLRPTHDPYANPNTQVYYECGCGAILDPGTKSFAALNNAASDKGWKVRWKQNGEGYEPFCVERMVEEDK